MIYGYICTDNINDITAFDKKYKKQYNIDFTVFDLIDNKHLVIQNNLKCIIENLQKGDILITEKFESFIYKKDIAHTLLNVINLIKDKKAILKILESDFNTSDSKSDYVIKVLDSVLGDFKSKHYEFKVSGRKPILLDKNELDDICEKIYNNELTLEKGAEQLGNISISTLHRRYIAYKSLKAKTIK